MNTQANRDAFSAYPRIPRRGGVRRSPFGRIITRADGSRKKVRLYIIWESAIQRCHNPKQTSYYRYGGRGISVCQEWRDDYAVFRAWAISNGYAKDLTLDRIDVNGNYEPANCRWLSPKQQQWNSRVVKFVTIDGVTKSLPEWCELNGVDKQLARSRLSSGWIPALAVTMPPMPPGSTKPGAPIRPRGRAAAKAKRLALLSSSNGEANDQR